MKKGKLNNNGFVLVETLIVTVFVMTIFAVLYNNFYPLMGEYEKREFYDDIDGKYAAYWVKKIVESKNYSVKDTNVTSGNYCYEFMCRDLSSSEQDFCNEYFTRSKIEHVYITKYNLEDFKNKLPSLNGFSGGMHKYVAYLPEYTVDSLNGAKYRVIVEFERSDGTDTYMAYSTFEVIK